MKKLPALAKLKPKDQKFVEEYVTNNKNGKQAALAAYDVNKNSAGPRASRVLSNPEVIEAIEVVETTLKEALINKGITPAKIADKINVLLDAQVVKRTYVKGDLISEVEMEDHNAIDKGLKHSLAIHGITPESPKGNGNTYNFFFNPELRKQIGDVEDQIKQSMLANLPPD